MVVVLNVVFVIAIVFIAYWFWWYKPSTKADVTNRGDIIDIKVDNGVYTPASVKAAVGDTVRLRFTRFAASGCAATVVFADFDKSAELPLEHAVVIEVTPDKIGRFDFTCEMGMYRGQLIVV